MKKEMQNYTQNRELSWLKFNQRVLEEAKDSSVPLLERMKFVSIFTSNLDEFFMIRVGSLYDMSLTDNSTIDSRSGMNPKEQLDAIFAAVAPLYKERDKTYSEIKKLLNPYGVCGLSIKELEQQEKKYVKKYFKDQILPILSPQIVDANHPFPHLLNKELYVIASLKQNGTSMIGIVPVPQFVSDILYLPGHDIRYIRMEKVIMEYLDVVFDKYEVSNKNYICVTRNADVSPDDEALEINDDFRLLMQDKDLAAVITTQGDATEADPSAPRAVFRQWGLDTLPLEQSGMQGLYVVDGGKVVYQKTGAGPLEYTLSWGGHDVTLRSAVDNSSTTVDGEEQSRNRPGVNVLVYDKVLDRVIQSISFSTLHAYSGYTA